MLNRIWSTLLKVFYRPTDGKDPNAVTTTTYLALTCSCHNVQYVRSHIPLDPTSIHHWPHVLLHLLWSLRTIQQKVREWNRGALEVKRTTAKLNSCSILCAFCYFWAIYTVFSTYTVFTSLYCFNIFLTFEFFDWSFLYHLTWISEDLPMTGIWYNK